MSLRSQKRILVAPLNWGLGHAVRIIPVIHILLEKGFYVVIAATGDSRKLLMEEFPNLDFIDFPSYKIKYSIRNSQCLKILFQIPTILYWTVREHIALKGIIRKYFIQIVLSDHRYGMWSRHTYNIFFIHQLNMQFPGGVNLFAGLLNKLQRIVIKKYDECWIPDYEFPDNLAGKLTWRPASLLNLKYIGPLSRFEDLNIVPSPDDQYDILVVLSGPEPQRTALEKKLEEELGGFRQRILFVRGVMGTQSIYSRGHLRYVDFLTTQNLKKYIQSAGVIICRSGYTSIMDLFVLKKRAIIIPTPGQPEQEYLAEHLSKKGYFVKTQQGSLDLKNAFNVLPDCQLPAPGAKQDLNEIIDDLSTM